MERRRPAGRGQHADRRHLRNDGGSQIARTMYGKWFHLNCAFDPATGIGRIWINNTLVHFRDITLWTR